MKNIGLLKISSALIQCIQVYPDVTSDELCAAIDDILQAPKDTTAVARLVALLEPRDMTVYMSDEPIEGGYGYIYPYKTKDYDAVMKVPYDTYDSSGADWRFDFVCESLKHILLYNFQTNQKRCFNIDTRFTCIPAVYMFIKTTDPSQPFALIMERLTETFENIIYSYLPLNDSLTLCIQVALDLYFLQTTLAAFRHNDLHLGNIMVKKLDQPMTMIVKLADGFTFTLTTLYTTYLIDFGRACLDLRACGDYLQLPDARLFHASINSCIPSPGDMSYFFLMFDEKFTPIDIGTIINKLYKTKTFDPAAVLKQLIATLNILP